MTNSTFDVRKDTNMDQLSAALNMLTPVIDAATKHKEWLDREKRKEAKVDKEKVNEFESYVHSVYAAHAGTKGEMINRIFDKHQIDNAKKGFEMRQMATAVKHMIPEYRGKHILEMMNNVDQWIREANILRIATKQGGKIHPTKIGHCRYVWHILYEEDDFKKQHDDLYNKFQASGQTYQNRIDEYGEVEQKKQEEIVEEPQEMIINNGGQVVGGE